MSRSEIHHRVCFYVRSSRGGVARGCEIPPTFFIFVDEGRTMEGFKSYVTDALERVTARVEEGLALFTTAADNLIGEQQRLHEEEHDWGDVIDKESPLSHLANAVLGDILSSQRGPQTIREHISAFTSAIRWNEPFVLTLLSLDLTLLLLTIYLIRRNSLVGRIIIFCIMASISRLLPFLNRYLSVHWEELHITQNYFDPSGTFLAIMLSAPLLLFCMSLLISLLWEAKNLVIQLKRLELQHTKSKQQSKNTPTKEKKDN
jgi:hypothetical protein